MTSISRQEHFRALKQELERTTGKTVTIGRMTAKSVAAYLGEREEIELRHSIALQEVTKLRKEVARMKYQAARKKEYTIESEEISELMVLVHEDIMKERVRQNRKWGRQRHPNEKWYTILGEEVGEVAQAIQRFFGWGKPTDADNLYMELIHVAAVAQAHAEQVREEMGHEEKNKGAKSPDPGADI